MSRTTTVSAPGKVLLAGGYLVLDPSYKGLVIATDSRFYTSISPLSSGSPREIRVRSAQFLEAEWVYVVGDDWGVRQTNEGPGNKFVALALSQTLRLASALVPAEELHAVLSSGLDISILGDNDFYSQRSQLLARSLPPTRQSLTQLPPFTPLPTTLAKVHKTGLGSSAALITSLVSALLAHTRAVDLRTREGVQWAHNAAQYVHCRAQGKVGSGFDVSSAVWGSHVYRRFGPGVIQGLLDSEVDPTPKTLHSTLSPSNPAWDQSASPIALPRGVKLLLADVDAGSDTPSLVGKVLAWRKAEPEKASEIYSLLSSANDCFAQTCRLLADASAADPEGYDAAVKALAGIPADQWTADSEATRLFVQARDTLSTIRAHLRTFSTLTSVPIEPPQQTRLLDACAAVPGVLGGGVPGAGGFDALYLLVLSGGQAEEKVGEVWRGWEEMGVCPLLAGEDAGAGEGEGKGKGKGVRVFAGVGEVRGLGEALARGK